MMTRRVALVPGGPPELDVPSTADSALAVAVDLGLTGITPGNGQTTQLWELLATTASTDLGAARVIEPHLDAVAILRQAGSDLAANEATWGVFAAEGGDDPLTYSDGRLTGTKPWCSLAGRLDAALVTAHVAAGQGDSDRGLFAVDMRQDGVTVEANSWHARGLVEIPSGPVVFAGVPATPVGATGWYLKRPGFEWGGMGVAACWHGGAVAIGRAVFAAVQKRPNPHALAHLGAIDELLESNRLALAEAARRVDDGTADRVLAKRVRATVARTVDEVIVRAGRALGPAPLALDAAHAKRVADLELYVRQYHAERDQASLGETITRSEQSPW